MATADGGDEKDTSATAEVSFDELAAAVASAVAGPRAGAPAAGVVAEALRRRDAGESFETIGAALAITAKRASTWCRTAARIDPRFDAREAKPRKKRVESQARTPLEKLIGWRPRPGTREVLERRAEQEGRSLTDLVQTAVDAYLGRKAAGVEVLVRRELRKGLKAELVALTAALDARERDLARQGSNLNQLVKFCHRYRELPVAITGELAATRTELEVTRAELTALRESVDRRLAE
ncbi:MAG: hypothetical protein QM809_18360 [Gordonia sp. (in: high G+C Gram-positive bacteria)]|uniref:hypothetical protein n=1 Tax=Gordonia sp. (in: high G+C Gram-positive bacteria) TaxID=84139 RepID=UPI0039E482B6